MTDSLNESSVRLAASSAFSEPAHDEYDVFAQGPDVQLITDNAYLTMHANQHQDEVDVLSMKLQRFHRLAQELRDHAHREVAEGSIVPACLSALRRWL